jgi:hypothetical protein
LILKVALFHGLSHNLRFCVISKLTPIQILYVIQALSLRTEELRKQYVISRDHSQLMEVKAFEEIIELLQRKPAI